MAGLRRLLDGWEDGIDLRDDIAEALLYPVESNSLRALLAVAEAGEELRERDVFYESYADCTDADLTLDATELRDMWLRFTAALAALKEA